MKATLKIEAFGDNNRQSEKLWRSILDGVKDGLGEAVLGKPPTPYWVAEIVGAHPKYRYERVFVSGKKDYANANGAGSRGVFAWFILESGKMYEVKKQTSWKSFDQYFCRVAGTCDIERMSKEEVDEWIKNISE